MSRKGWRQRWREGQARTHALNLAALERRLETLGAEERLDRIQTRFRQALADARPKTLGLGVLSALVFLSVVALGLVLTE